jgi:4-hydroxy-tetrahydrodipicolinate reductase
MLSMKIAIAGCTGRMGITLIKATLASPAFTLAAGSERPGFDAKAAANLLAGAGAAELRVTSDAAELAELADAVIDFTAPEATLPLAKALAKQGKVHIIGTTGFTAEQQQELAGYATKARIVQSGNFSLGVNILEALVEQAARLLDEQYDIEINEMHHRHKKDAPSGTALMLGRAAARGRSVQLAEKQVLDRDGVRKSGDIGFSVLRGGDVVGVHDVLFAGPGELVTLSHQGFSRDIYAYGALAAARWAHTKTAGLYSMRDVLKL